VIRGEDHRGVIDGRERLFTTVDPPSPDLLGLLDARSAPGRDFSK
jgi:hypothetical protein